MCPHIPPASTTPHKRPRQCKLLSAPQVRGRPPHRRRGLIWSQSLPHGQHSASSQGKALPSQAASWRRARQLPERTSEAYPASCVAVLPHVRLGEMRIEYRTAAFDLLPCLQVHVSTASGHGLASCKHWCVAPDPSGQATAGLLSRNAIGRSADSPQWVRSAHQAGEEGDAGSI